MKILALDLQNNFAKLKIDNIDDLWVLSRILDIGDIIGSQTTRITKKEEEQKEKRKKLYLKLKVEKIEFKKGIKNLRILGTITESSNPDVTLGSYHTLVIERKSAMDITKEEFQKWQIERLKDSAEASKRPQLIMCVADYGDAHIVMLREFGIEAITNLRKSMPGKKREGVKIYEKARVAFMEKLAQTLEDVSEAKGIEKIVLGGPGFFNENFKKVLENNPDLKKRILFAKIYNPGKPGITELIKRGIVEKALKGSRIDQETKMVEKFFSELSKQGLAAYGIEDVKAAIDYGAAETLLVSDAFIQKLKEADGFKELNELMKVAEAAGAKIMIISDEHEAGERFSAKGIGAVLRYKV